MPYDSCKFVVVVVCRVPGYVVVVLDSVVSKPFVVLLLCCCCVVVLLLCCCCCVVVVVCTPYVVLCVVCVRHLIVIVCVFMFALMLYASCAHFDQNTVCSRGEQGFGHEMPSSIWPQKIKKVDEKIIRLTDKTIDIEKKLHDELFKEMSKSFGCSTTKSVVDSIKELKMADKNWTLANFTEYAHEFYSRVQGASMTTIPDIKTKFIDGLRPRRFAERVKILEKVDEAPNDIDGIKVLLRQGGIVWNEILETFEEAKELGMIPDQKEVPEEEERQASGTSEETSESQYRHDDKKKHSYCKICKTKGHWTSECRKISTIVNATKYSTGFKETAKIKGKEIEVLLDTGAEMSCVAESLAKRMKLKLRPCHIVLSLADGSERIIKYMTDVVITMENVAKETIVLKEECLVVGNRGKNQPLLILKRDTCLKHDLLKRISCNSIDSEDFGVQIRDLPKKEEIEANIADEVKKELTPVLLEYFESVDMTKTANVEEFEIKLKSEGDVPMKQQIYPIPFALQEFARKEIDELLKRKHIVPTKSGNPAPTIVVKNHEKLRMVIDFRKLNEKVQTDTFPIPLQADLFQRLQKAKYFSQIDLKNGYHNIAMAKGSEKLSAFAVPWGVYEWRVMPFGIKTAPSHFQRVMERLFGHLEGCVCYLDDLLIMAETKEDIITRTKEVVRILKEKNLIVNVKKSHFGYKRVKYLGFMFERGKVEIDESKKTVIRMFRTPKTKRQLKSFLGMLNFLREFVPNMAVIAAPLYNATNGPGVVSSRLPKGI
ncbi:hypothetical protein ADUPG1_010240 [Aduncisulcus paluster]|uniref:Reverse transcriptase domain-containing protein n=1 Tax=Aduncisulcus paluster TaxID=2918883 RepID=A0ABQ5JQG1_9EUKA|nr:hypothetical protein ADUPG1_010240 [Aduncisulcus paluster]